MNLIRLMLNRLNDDKGFSLEINNKYKDSFSISIIYIKEKNQYHIEYRNHEKLIFLSTESLISYFTILSLIDDDALYKDYTYHISSLKQDVKDIETYINFKNDVLNILGKYITYIKKGNIDKLYNIDKMQMELLNSKEDNTSSKPLEDLDKLMNKKKDILNKFNTNSLIINILNSLLNNKDVKLSFRSGLIIEFQASKVSLLSANIISKEKLNQLYGSYANLVLLFCETYNLFDYKDTLKISYIPSCEKIDDITINEISKRIIETYSTYNLPNIMDIVNNYFIKEDLKVLNIELNNINKDKSKKSIRYFNDYKENFNIIKQMLSKYYKDIIDGKITYKNYTSTLEKLKINYQILNNINYIKDPCIKKDDELKKLEIILLMENKSPILVGPAGVGKTALVEGLAYRIKNNMINNELREKEIIKVSTSELVSGCEYIGTLEKRTTEIFNYFVKHPEYILFLDEIHSIIGMGSGEKSFNSINQILKPYLDRGLLKLIGATTDTEYDEIVKLDPAFKRRLQKIEIKPPKEDILYDILFNHIEYLKERYDINTDNLDMDNIINIIISLTKECNIKYDDKLYNPDISIGILDIAIANMKYNNRNYLTIDDIIYGISSCDYIYPSIKDRYIYLVSNLPKVSLLKKEKLIYFNRYK